MTIANVTVTSFNEASTNPSFTHTPVGGDPKGVLIFTSQVYTGTSVTAVTYGGETMTEVPGSPNNHSTGEDGQASAWFLGENIPTGAQTVQLTAGFRNRAITCFTVTAAGDMDVEDTDDTIDSDAIANPTATLLLGGNICFCAMSFGSGALGVSDITPLTNWTSDNEIDFGSQVGGIYSYDIIASTDVTMGWTQVTDDAWAIGVAIKEIAGGASVSPDDLTQAQSIDNVTLTQHNALSSNDISQSQTIGNVSLTQHNVLAVDDLTQGQNIDNVVLVVAAVLQVFGLTQAQSISAAALVQHNNLSVNDLSQAQSIDNVILVDNAVTLTVNDLSQAQSIDQPALSQHNILSVNDLTQNQLIDAVFLGGVVVGYLKGEISVFSAYNSQIKVISALTGEVSVINPLKIQ